MVSVCRSSSVPTDYTQYCPHSDSTVSKRGGGAHPHVLDSAHPIGLVEGGGALPAPGRDVAPPPLP